VFLGFIVYSKAARTSRKSCKCVLSNVKKQPKNIHITEKNSASQMTETKLKKNGGRVRGCPKKTSAVREKEGFV